MGFCVSETHSWASLHAYKKSARQPGRTSNQLTPVAATAADRSRCLLAPDKCVAGVLLLLCLLLALPAWADTVSVSITGIEGRLLDNVERSLSLLEEEDAELSERQIRRLYRAGTDEARRALAPYGYYNPEIQAELQEPAEGSSEWHARYDVATGPPTHIKQLQLDIIGPGRNFSALRQVLAASRLHEGDQLQHQAYKSTKNTLSETAYGAGFLNASFSKSEVRVDPKNNSAAITLILDTGERYFFGPVHVEQDFLDPRFVQKLVPITPGEPYNANRLLDLQLILTESDYFSQVMINPQRDAVRRQTPLDSWFYNLLWPEQRDWGTVGELQVPIDVAVEPSKPQHYRISAGYGTDTGPRVGFGVKFRHLNKWGHQFRQDVRISEIERTLHASYDIPIENVIRDRLSFTGELSNQKFGDITSNYARLGVVRDTGWKLGRHRPYLNLLYERYDLRDGHGTRSSHLLYPGYAWTLRWLDDEIKTRKGYALNFDVRGAGKALGSSTNFVRGKLSGGLIWPTTERTRLLLRGEIGAMAASQFRDVPPSQRFFAGGASSVRGYSYQSLAPQADNGDRIGGRYLLVGSIEADYRFYKDFYIASFFDIGNAANTFAMDFRRGAGIGFRWASPVGMIRLDFAHPHDSDSKFRIHFGLGAQL